MHRYYAILLSVVVIALGVAAHLSAAQAPDPKTAQRICEAVQNQIDQIRSIADSTAVSDEEKVAKLKEIWMQSWQEIQNFAQDDPDMSAQLKQLSGLIAALLFEADDPRNAGKKDVSDQAKAALAQIKERIKPYMTVMKMMCPQLVLPPALSAE
jgi:hypothetical protein